MKLAIEVEGRYKGLKTLFIESENDKAELIDALLAPRKIHAPYVKWLKLLVHENKCQQISICDQYNKVPIVRLGLLRAAVGCIVAIERTELCSALPADIHVILRVEGRGGKYLRTTDEIKFEPADRYVYMTSLETMVKSTPDDYLMDMELP